MRSSRTAEQVLRLATITSPASAFQPYICTICRARQFSTSSSHLTEIPLYKRLQNSLFGTKESKSAAVERQEKTKKRLEEASQNPLEDLEVKTDRSGREYKVAAVVDTSINQDYVQASTWDGLEIVGGEEWVRKRADRGERYVGFVSGRRVELSQREWRVLLRHVVVEAVVLRQAGREVGEVCLPREEGSENCTLTKAAEVKAGSEGVTVSFADAEAERSILEAISKEVEEVQTQEEQALVDEVNNILAAGGEDAEASSAFSWLDLALLDPTLKLAVLKRTLQLTGKRLPDPALTSFLSSHGTLADLLNALKTKPKPKKLAQTKTLQRLKVEVPNVTVHSRRQTPIDKEKKVGRWKVIEQELVARDLPVTGSRWQGAKANVWH